MSVAGASAEDMPVTVSALSQVLTSEELASTSSAMTRDIGRRFGMTLKRGDCVFLFGEIGAGKTVFVNGIAEALGIRGPLQSPTFTISNVHKGKITLYHFDAYRITSVDELRDTGFYEYLEGDGVVALEWAQRLPKDALPGTRIEVWIDQYSAARRMLDDAMPPEEEYNENRRNIRMTHYHAPISS